MKEEDKSKEQLVYELGEMRRRVSELESAISRARARSESRPAVCESLGDEAKEQPATAEFLESTQTIDLTSVFAEDVTSSGSFSFGGVRRTWFGRLLQALPIPAFLFDQSFAVIFMNGACRRISEDYHSVRGKPFHDLFENPWVAEEARDLMEKVFHQRLRESLEAVLRIGQDKIWGRLYMRSIRLGTSRSVLVMVEDLTLEKEQLVLKQKHEEQIIRERDELEQRVRERTHDLVEANEEIKREMEEREFAQRLLMEREERYRLLVEKAPVGIVSCSTEGSVTEFNPAFLKILSIPYHAANDLNLMTSGPLINSGFSKVVRTCLESGEPCCQEFGCEVEAGKELSLRLHVVPQRRNDDTISGIQAVVEDISGHKRAEALLLRSERLRALVEMAGGVAHNFNTSLQAVAADAQAAMSCLETGRSQEIKSLLEQILDNALQTANTVRRLKQFARSRTAVATSEVSVFDVSEALREGVENGRRLCESEGKKQGNNVTVVSDLADGCHVEGDYKDVIEIVMILMRNSIEAMPSGGEIAVRSHVEDGRVVIQVADDGIGIAKKDLEKIFEPFWTTKPAHVGMGLAVATGIVRRHQGTLAVTSKTGQGTNITVKLPLVKKAESELRGETRYATASRFRILLICNDEILAEELDRELGLRGQVTFVAATGPEGVKIFDEEDVDTVVCDQEMKDLSVWEVTQALREIAEAKRSLRPRVILLVEESDDSRIDALILRSEADRVVRKPVDADRLLQIMDEEAKKAVGQASFSGRIHGIDILEYVQLLMISGQQVIVEIVSREGIRGYLYVNDGKVVHAICDGLEGEDALYKCLGFNGGNFASLPWHEPRNVTINKPGELVLLEAARLRDEMNTANPDIPTGM
ncbi:MAG: ATP-binding protein [Pseudomonadota bacterium]